MKTWNTLASKASSNLPRSTRRTVGHRANPCKPPCLERLEDRALFSTYVVDLLGDPAVVPTNHYSLRTAITKAESQSGSSLIEFNPNVFNTNKTIYLAAPLKLSNAAAKVAIIGPAAGVTLDQDLSMFDSTTLYVKTNATLGIARVDFLTDAGFSGTSVVNNAGNFYMEDGSFTCPGGLDGITAIKNTGKLTLQRVTISNHGDYNSGITAGGGLNNDGIANLRDVIFQNDDAGAGGAISQTGGSLTAVNVTFNSCASDTNAEGGAVAINLGKSSFTNCTFDGSVINSESSPTGCRGAALYVRTGTTTLLNDTITNSTIYTLGYGMPGDVPTAGAIGIGSDAKLIIGNTLVSGMAEEGGSILGTGPEIVGHFTSLGHNLIGQTSPLTQGLVASDLRGTNASPMNPKLAPLANNGGYTLTELPQSGSALINAGDNSLLPVGDTQDQRGHARVQGGTVDIGAVEADPILIAPWPVVIKVFK